MDRSYDRRDVLKVLAVLGISVSEPNLAAAQTPAASDLAGGKVIFDDEHVRVIQHAGRPRMGVCGTGYHSHPPHLTILLTDVKAKVTLPGKDPFTAENKAGDVFWDRGGPHIVENIGSGNSKVYLVELKGRA